jgi:hypothetical protein
MGGEAPMKADLTLVLADQAMRCMDVFDMFGQLTPKLWAVGPRLKMVAEPARADCYTLPELERTHLLAAMICRTRARFAGRCDEVWTTSNPKNVGRRLAPLAEVDPTVRTGLVIIGVDIKRQIVNGAVCEPHLGEFGEPEWYVGGLSERAVEQHIALLELAARLVPPEPLPEMAERFGWTLMEEARRG